MSHEAVSASAGAPSGTAAPPAAAPPSAEPPAAEPPPAEPAAVDLYARMSYLRAFEERADSLYRQGLIHGPVHLGLGHEAIAVGAASVLRPGDYSIGTYRGHAHALARGAPPDAVFAELLGRAGGICAGKGGSMHITSAEHGYYGSYAIVGAHLPIACGLGWAAKIRRSGQVTACFFGDGATNIGAFHEAVNLAAVWRLPVIFICENNWYMEYTPIGDVIPVALPAADRAAAYGLGRVVVDGNDVQAVRQVVGSAVAAAREGHGPALIEAQTYRLKGHSAADGAAYRPAEEVARWREHDPLLRARRALQLDGVTAAALDEIEAGARAGLIALTESVLARPAPDPATAWTDVWSDGGSQWRS